jgi:hypothetical protein
MEIVARILRAAIVTESSALFARFISESDGSPILPRLWRWVARRDLPGPSSPGRLRKLRRARV